MTEITGLIVARLHRAMANGSRPRPHPLLKQRIVELYEQLHELNRHPDFADLKRIAWILGELDKAGAFEAPPPDDGDPLTRISKLTGIPAVWLLGGAVLVAMWAGPGFWSFFARLISLFG